MAQLYTRFSFLGSPAHAGVTAVNKAIWKLKVFVVLLAGGGSYAESVMVVVVVLLIVKVVVVEYSCCY